MEKETHATAVHMTIGTLARAANVNVETIRYYQRVGLIQEPPKPLEGYRRYPQAAIARVCFIKRAKGLGFTLKEILELLSLDDGNCAEVRTLAEHKHEVIRQRINDLKAMQEALGKLIKTCQTNIDGQAHCTIITTLSNRDPVKKDESGQ